MVPVSVVIVMAIAPGDCPKMAKQVEGDLAGCAGGFDLPFWEHYTRRFPFTLIGGKQGIT